MVWLRAQGARMVFHVPQELCSIILMLGIMVARELFTPVICQVLCPVTYIQVLCIYFLFMIHFGHTSFPVVVGLSETLIV